MTFRSPPPHRHSSGHKGGKSQFEKDQIDFQRMVQQLGYSKLPINDETLRPFLEFLWGFGEARGHKVWTFDQPGGPHPDRLYFGLMGSVVPLQKIRLDMTEALKRSPLWGDVERAHPVFTLGGMCMLYFEGIWTPKAALQSRRH